MYMLYFAHIFSNVCRTLCPILTLLNIEITLMQCRLIPSNIIINISVKHPGANGRKLLVLGSVKSEKVNSSKKVVTKGNIFCFVSSSEIQKHNYQIFKKNFWRAEEEERPRLFASKAFS